MVTIVTYKKHSRAGCFLWRQNNPEVNYSPTRISGGGVVSRGGIAQNSKGDEIRYLEARIWDVGMWTGLGWPRTGTGGGNL